MTTLPNQTVTPCDIRSQAIQLQLQQQIAALLSAGYPQQALQLAETAITAGSGNADLYHITGACAAALGDCERAERYWRQTILTNSRVSEPFFNLGLLCARSRRDEEAEQYYRQAISINSRNVGAINNLGLLLMRKNREEEAEYWYRRAILIPPGNTQSYTNLGAILAGRKQDEEAEHCYRRAIALDASNAEAHANLGALLAGRKQIEEAERCYRQAIALDSCNSAAYSNLGLLLVNTQQFDEAERCYRQAISLNVSNAEAYTNLGLLLGYRKQENEAEACHRKAIELCPESAEIHTNLANLISNQTSRAGDSENHYLQAIRLSPEKAYPYSNYGVFLMNQCREDESERIFQQALTIDPHYQRAHLNLGFLLLSQGRFEEGWIHHEARYDSGLPDNGIPVPDVSFPKWQGESLAGKSLLVWQEQGFGDAIQFCRYLPQMKKQWGVSHITYVCKSPLKLLMETLQNVDTVKSFSEIGSEIEAHDYWTLPLSIPLYWKGETGTFPTRVPYLKSLPERVSRWERQLPGSGFRVGVVWRGNARHHNDGDRSLPDLSVLLPLWTIPGIQFISLQKERNEDLAAAPSQGQPLLNLGSELADFSDTAAVIVNLDLVISVDTAVAHLAGSLGKACWVLLPAYRTDWRWLHGRNDSPWYPGVMRLFRQTERGNWTPVIDTVRESLRQLVLVHSKSSSMSSINY